MAHRVALGMSLTLIIGCGALSVFGGEITVTPRPYDRALRNPLKGFTSDSEWETLKHTYIRWSDLEDKESDGIDRIRAYCDKKWEGLAERNVKAIPRVYLHWSKDTEKYWPSDMRADDYTSPQFKKRVLRLVERLGACWDNDPRVAFVELGIFGKWGEHHSPDPTPEMQKWVGAAFAKAFKNKLVSVRQPWQKFAGLGFGAYWDSWAHHQQMWGHGSAIAKLNENGLWKKNYIGGEVAYNWGDWKTQPGATPTASVVEPVHREFLLNSIRWLHCSQLRWIAAYDETNPDAVKGAEELQKAFGYRFVLNETRFSTNGVLTVAFKVTNKGSAPVYYNWPVEVSLVDIKTRKPVWRSTFKDTDIRLWLPGDGWAAPQFKRYDRWPNRAADWGNARGSWQIPARTYTVSGTFNVRAPGGTYILALSVLDPGGNLPCLRFATANYLNGGRHPIGLFAVGVGQGGPLPEDFTFDDPHDDRSLHYTTQPTDSSS